MSSYIGTVSPTVELILSEIRNIKEDLQEQKSCVVCLKSTEVMYRIDDSDKRIKDEQKARETEMIEIRRRLERFTQIAISTLVVAILNLLSIIVLYKSQSP